ARRLQTEHGLDLLIIDYLQLMESSRYTDNRVQEVSAISRGLKKLAIELQVPVMALSQLSRAVEMRTDQRPKLSDLRESGSIEQDADVVMFLHRQTWEGEERPEVMEVDLLIEKHRNGPTGEIPLQFNTQNVSYSETEQFHMEEPMPTQHVPA
ncbi:MAG TPA: DnaB-like helicase C-terminal domain-containing protein, partial [Candidatus Andersenbacteria bacterium]|nr:DnaB-like helicase C-terminal domain-containing protein [Candidatus Andersenbacteria bacterium]